MPARYRRLSQMCVGISTSRWPDPKVEQTTFRHGWVPIGVRLELWVDMHLLRRPVLERGWKEVDPRSSIPTSPTAVRLMAEAHRSRPPTPAQGSRQKRAHPSNLAPAKRS